MNRSETISLLGFVPALVVQYLSEKQTSVVVLPDKQSFKSVVMFADISGFTNLTETLHKLGHEGCEMTAFAINRYMELLVKAISRSGGDIFKFAGDAMIVVWPPPTGQTSLETLCRQAIQSALDIQAKLHDTYILQNIKLSVKIGFGVGQISIIYTGGVFGRCEYLASGDPLTQAFNSEHHASAGGETLISPELFEVVKDYFDFHESPADSPECYHVKNVKGKVRMKADAIMIKNNLDMIKFEMVKKELLGYIPAALLPYIENGQESWGNELRNLTIMFLNLGVDLSCTNTNEGLKRIQNVMQTVQKCIYIHEGSLNKLLMDDKGSTLIVVFGLPPMCHQDDAARAILTAFLLVKELKKLACPVSIGIATGTVFAGVVGTSGSRREYSVLGDEVNLSARLMQLACGEKQEKIILCRKTREQSSGTITSVFYKEVMLKGKANPVPVFIPLEPIKEMKKSPVNIKVHNESEQIKYEDVIQDEIMTPAQPMIGQDDNIQRALDSFLSILRREKERQFLLISGGFGVGKSHVLKFCIQRVTEMIKAKQFGKFKYDEQPHILVTVLNPIERKLKLNGLRYVLRQILNIVAARQKRQVHTQYIGELFQDILQENNDYFKEFCLLINPPLEPIQHFPAPIPEPTKEEIKGLTAFVSATFSKYLESDVRARKVSIMKQSSGGSIAPLILVFPNAEHLDEATLMLLKHILKRYEIMLVMLVRDHYTEIPMVGLKTQEQIFDTVSDGILKISQSIPEDVVNIELSTLKRQGLENDVNKDEYKQFIKLHFGIESFREQINLQELQMEMENDQQTYFDSRRSVKRQNIEQQDKGNTIRQKMRDHLLFSETKQELIDVNFSEYVFHYLYLKTMGHALATKQWLSMFIEAKQIVLDGKVAEVSKELKQVFMHEEAIVLDAPFVYVQINGQIIDKLGCFNCLILKVASVIGEIFDLNTLAKIHPFQSTIHQDKLIKLLDELEQRDILEVMEVQSDNTFYRFQFPFFRECIYQRMTYAQRRQIHQLVAEAYQLMPQVYDFNEKISESKLKVHWELSEQKAEQQNVSHKAKRAFIVKKLRQQLSADTKSNSSQILFSGLLTKKSEKNITWSSRFCVLTPSSFVYYYSEQNDQTLGQFQFKYIHSITALNEPTQTQKLLGGQRNVLQIQTSQWIKKSKIMVEERKFYFAAENEEKLEQWIIYLEFLKAKAIYDQFVEQFGKIPFPLQPAEKFIATSVGKNYIKFAFRQQTNPGKQRMHSKRMSRICASRKFHSDSMMQTQILLTQDDHSTNNWQNEIQTLKPYLHQFLIKSLYILFAHIFERTSNKDEGTLIGGRLQVMVKHPWIFKISKENLVQEYQRTSSQLPTISEEGGLASQVFRQKSSLVKSDALQVQDSKYRGSMVQSLVGTINKRL